jgi:hypothetical protein
MSRETRDDVFDEAAAFAGQLLPKQVIGISHALEKEHVVVVAWYWSQGSFWTCPRCGESIEDQFDSCWSCSGLKPEIANSISEVQDSPGEEEEGFDSVAYRTDRGSWLEWDDFFDEVAKLATAIGPKRLVSIAHSGTKDDALATVFYFGKE